MAILELNEREKNLLEILRVFEFVKEYRYNEYKFLYYINAYPSVHFKNHQLNQVLSIIGSDFGCTENDYSIIIEKRSVFSYKVLSISDYYEIFGSGMIKGRNYTLKSQAEFIQQYLMQVLKGEMWIDELIKQNAKLRRT